MDPSAAEAPAEAAAAGETESDNKRLRNMVDAFDAMGIKAAVSLEQKKDWYEWRDTVVVAVLPHRIYGSAWVVTLDLTASALMYRRFDPSDYPGSSMSPVGPAIPLEGSQRWSSIITSAKALAEGLPKSAVGKSTVEFCISLHYLRETQTLLGVDTAGLYQVWEMSTGIEIQSGRFTHKKMGSFKMAGEGRAVTKEMTYYVRMNAICHTTDWIIGATCLDEDGTRSAIFAINRKTNEQMPTIFVNITGIKDAENHSETSDMVWFATDSGPFFIDTRYPHCMWAMIPAGRWIEALGIEDELVATLDSNRYLSRFEECAKNPEYRLALETSNISDPDSLDPKIRADFEMVGHFNTKRYQVMHDNAKPYFILTADDGQLLTIGEKMFSWTSTRDAKIVPGDISGLLCGAFVKGGIVMVHEDRKVIMVQAPWADRETADADYAEKVIARAFDAGVETKTRISDLPNVDTKYMVARITENIVFVHACDDGIYRFDTSDKPAPTKIEDAIVVDVDAFKRETERIPGWMSTDGVDLAMIDGLMQEEEGGAAAAAPMTEDSVE